MNNQRCFFIGNRHTPNSIKKQLTEVVEQHIFEYGVNIFVVGHYGEFDKLVQVVLRDAKKRQDNIELYLLAPYALTNKISTPKGFNGILYPNGLETGLKRFSIVHANRYMIKHSNYLISYCRSIGNTRNFIEYAQKREKKGLIKVTLL